MCDYEEINKRLRKVLISVIVSPCFKLLNSLKVTKDFGRTIHSKPSAQLSTSKFIIRQGLLIQQSLTFGYNPTEKYLHLIKKNKKQKLYFPLIERIMIQTDRCCLLQLLHPAQMAAAGILRLGQRSHFNHRPQQQQGTYRYSCEQCGRGFSSTTGRTAHMVSAHGRLDLSNPCPICSKCFTQKAKMKKHVIAHHGLSAEETNALINKNSALNFQTSVQPT